VWPRRRPSKTSAAIRQATADAAESLSRARADHARESDALGRDTGLIESLREIRRENHFTDIVTAAFRGES
jgi:hypothetical protein